MSGSDDNTTNAKGSAKWRSSSNKKPDSGSPLYEEELKDDSSFIKRSVVAPLPANVGPNANIAQQTLSQTVVTRQANFTFFGIFGLYGPPLLALAGTSILWVVWLIALNIYPNETANILTGTSNYDDGEFWLIGKPNLELTVVSVIGLILVTLLYAKALVLLVFRSATKSIFKQQHQIVRKKSFLRKASFLLRPANDVLDYEGAYRRLWNIGQEVLDIILQATSLYRLMESGSLELMYACAALIFCNSISYAGLTLCGRRISSFKEAVIGLVFDSMVAIGFPMTALFFCYSRLEIDYDVLDLNNDLIPRGNFGRIARLAADPIETTQFMVSFNALLIRRFPDFVVQVALHLSSSYRLIKITETLIYEASSIKTNSQPICVKRAKRKQIEVPRIVAILFVACAALALAVPMEAVRYSEAACLHQPECVIFAYRWQTTENCPCLGLVDVEKAPKSYREWLQPKDATEKLKALSISGDLQILKITNRGVKELPKEMAACTNLRQIYLMYTGLMEIPDWANALSNLEILHIEGKVGDTNLVRIPTNFFDNKQRLVFLHLGVHPLLKEIPPLDGLINLRTLTIVQFYSLTTLPSFNNLRNLKTLIIVHASKLFALPQIDASVDLTLLAIVLQAPLCCNGFLGNCNLDHPYCQADPLSGNPPASCLPANTSRASSNMLALFNRFNRLVCQVPQLSYEDVMSIPTEEKTGICGGVMYKQCSLGTDRPLSICYNRRLMVISCVSNSVYIQLRKQQIERNIGPPCDPEVEAWLGCK